MYQLVLNQSENEITMRRRSTLVKIRIQSNYEHRGDKEESEIVFSESGFSVRIYTNLNEKINGKSTFLNDKV